MGSHVPRENMIPLGKDKIHDAKVRAKLKGSASQKRKTAQQIRRMKEKPDNKIDERIMKLITDPNISAAQIQDMIEVVAKTKGLNTTNRINLINTVIRKHQAIFGSSVKVDADVRLSNADAMLSRLTQFKETMEPAINKDLEELKKKKQAAEVEL